MELGPIDDSDIADVGREDDLRTLAAPTAERAQAENPFQLFDDGPKTLV